MQEEMKVLAKILKGVNKLIADLARIEKSLPSARKQAEAIEKRRVRHLERKRVVRELRREKRKTGYSWLRLVRELRQNPEYKVQMRPLSDSTWVRYAKG